MERAFVGIFIGVIISVIGWMIIDRVSEKAGQNIAMKCIKYGKFEHDSSVYECKEVGR